MPDSAWGYTHTNLGDGPPPEPSGAYTDSLWGFAPAVLGGFPITDSPWGTRLAVLRRPHTPIGVKTATGMRYVPLHVYTGQPLDAGYDLIVGVGQSNVAGAATDWVSGDQYSSADISMWHHGNATIVPAVEPLSIPNGTSAGMGAMNTFVKAYAENSLASGRKVLVVNAALGGTGFRAPSTNETGAGYHWDRTLAADSNNLALRARATVLSALAAAGAGSRVVAVFANHGSNDGVNFGAGGKAAFKATLQDFITWFRGQISAPDAPYMMMQMRPSLLSEGRHNAMDQAQTETASEMPRVLKGTSPNGSEYNRADSVHFNANGMRVIGHNLYAKYVEIVP